MTTQSQKSGLQQAIPVVVFGTIIFLVGALIGYCRGALGADGTQTQGLEWAWKSGLLFLIMTILAGTLGGYFLQRWKFHPSISWGIMMGLAFAFMYGGGSIIEGRGEEAIQQIVEGLLFGALVGAVVGPINQRVAAEKNNKHNSENGRDTSEEG